MKNLKIQMEENEKFKFSNDISSQDLKMKSRSNKISEDFKKIKISDI